MRRVPFNALPQPVRERLHGYFTGATPVIAYEPRTAAQVGQSVRKPGAFAGGLVAFFVLRDVITRLREGYGSDHLAFLILGGATFVLTWSVLGLLHGKRWPPPPWREARVALPGSIVNLDGGWLEVSFVSDLAAKPEVIHVSRNGSYSYSLLRFGAAGQFSFGKRERATEVATQILESAERVAADPKLDPFAEWRAAGFAAEVPAGPVQGPSVAVGPSGAGKTRVKVAAGVAVAAAVGGYFALYAALAR